MADQQQSAAQFLAELPQNSHHLPCNRHIQAGGGFVGDHQGGAEGDGQGHGQALTHAAAELMGVGPEAVGSDTHLLQQLLGTLEAFALAHSRPVGTQGVQQMAAHGHQRIQACHRILKHQAHRLAAQRPQVRQAEAAGIATVQG